MEQQQGILREGKITSNIHFYLFIGLFIVFEFLFGTSVLDYASVNLVNFGSAQQPLAIALSMIFFVGALFGLKVLQSPEQQPRMDIIKRFYSVYLVVTPLLVLLPPSLVNVWWYFSGGSDHANGAFSLVIALTVLVVFITLVFALSLVWSFDFFWLEYRKSQLAMLIFVLSLVIAIMIYFVTQQSMAGEMQLWVLK